MKKNWVALQTILVKEMTRFLRIWSQTLLPPVITMSLYFIIFGKLIGSQIKAIDGYTYMQYIVPGLTMMAIMTNAYANTSASFFGAKFSKSIEEMLVSSMPSYVILLGYVVGGALRGLLVGFIVILISLLFTHIHIHHIGIVLSMAFLSAMLFSLGGLINGIFAKKFDDVSFVPTFILTPLTYLGGVFYSIKQLPPFWQKISIFNPILDIVDTFRYGMLGTSDINIYLGFLLVSVLFILLLVSCLKLLEKGTGLRT
ncbi:MAG: ABC-2 type transporter superfamily [uncultured bacterium]|nr:MAG: ABC-2 type transporter superfamily [uncultured bacterium]